MARVRSTTTCKTGTIPGSGVQYTLKAIPGRPTIGDDSVEYQVDVPSQRHIVQVYVRIGGVLSVCSYATNAPTTAADLATAEALAARGARQLVAKVGA